MQVANSDTPFATNLVPFNPAYNIEYPPYTNGVDEQWLYGAPPYSMYHNDFPHPNDPWLGNDCSCSMLPENHFLGGGKRYRGKKNYKHMKKKIVDEDDDDFVDSHSKAKHGTLHKMKRAFKKFAGKHMLPGEFGAGALDDEFPGPGIRPLSDYSDTVTPRKHAFKEFHAEALDDKFPGLDIQPVLDYSNLATPGKRAYKKTAGQQMFPGEFDAGAFENKFPGLEIQPVSDYSDMAMAKHHDAPFMDSKPRRGHMGPSASLFSQFFGGMMPRKAGNSEANTETTEHDEAPQHHMQGPRKYKEPLVLKRDIEDAEFDEEAKTDFDHQVADIVEKKFDAPVREKYTEVQEQMKQAQKEQKELQRKLNDKMKFFEQEHQKRMKLNKHNFQTHFKTQADNLKKKLEREQEKKNTQSTATKTHDTDAYTQKIDAKRSEIKDKIVEIGSALEKIGDDESNEFKNTTNAIQKKLKKMTTSERDDEDTELEANVSSAETDDVDDDDDEADKPVVEEGENLTSEEEESGDDDEKEKKDKEKKVKKKKDGGRRHKEKEKEEREHTRGGT